MSKEDFEREFDSEFIDAQAVEIREPESIEFQVDEGFVKNLPAILSNVRELQAWAKKVSERDRKVMLVSDEDMSAAKERCAKYNKVIEQIESRRKDVKKEYEKPLKVFEIEIKKAVDTLKAAKENLWSQWLAADSEKREAKKAVIAGYYASAMGELARYRPFEEVYQISWTNKSVRLESVYAEIDSIKALTEATVKVVETLPPDIKPAVMIKYKDGADLNEILDYAARLRAEKMGFQSENSTGGTNTNTGADIAADSKEKAVEDGISEDTIINSVNGEELIVVDFRVFTTKEKLAALKKFLLDNGIKYGKVPINTDIQERK